MKKVQLIFTGVLALFALCLPLQAEEHAASSAASAQVPLDNWLYQAVDRLSAVGCLQPGFAGLRPWTRREFARILRNDSNVCPESVRSLLDKVREEFATELAGEGTPRVTIDSIYVRGTHIAGQPLEDDFHFGRSIVNDFGRPAHEGVNAVAGFRASATAGPLGVSVRGEYQHAPSAAALPQTAVAEMSRIDSVPRTGPTLGRVNNFKLIEATAAVALRSVQFSVGKQSLMWGPGRSGAMLVGQNAEPLYMLRLSQTTPWRIPILSRVLGPARWDAFMGKLSGHRNPRSPWIHGQKISFQPTENLELGFARTVMFAGGDRPWASRFWRSFWSVGNHINTTPGGRFDIGDRRGGFDLKYRVPGLRNWLTIYNDAFTDDDPSPLSAPARSGMTHGLYLTRVPRVPKLDFRLEMAYTAALDTPPNGQFFYVNGAYREGYTNKGRLLGHWVGRQGRAYQGWLTYWLRGTSKVELSYRRLVVGRDYITGGGRQQSLSVGTQLFSLQNSLIAAVQVQAEQWRYSVLAPTSRRNVSASLGFEYRPRRCGSR